MQEALLALGIFVALAGVAAAFKFAAWEPLAVIGGWMIAGGLAFSLPVALLYHWRLYRALAPRGELPRRWYWSPTAYHDKLRPEERARVLGGFYLGAAGWGVTVIGCGLVALAVFVGRR